MSIRLPLVVILGATGSGKTKLSLELAQKFAGEIIGADSMQLYKGLDIITAKATKAEQSLVPHHLIDILEPINEISTVIDYRNMALKIIDNLLINNKLPIVVGGTNYYIESILWKILIGESCSNLVTGGINNLHTVSSEVLHDELKLLDPTMAKRLHPNNKRKILRSLEVLHQNGRKMSDILEEQQSKGGSYLGGGLRYRNVIIFKLECNQEILDERLNNRVDKMMKLGLVDELLSFHKLYNQHRLGQIGKADYTKGIYQSIGFKEFHSFLQLSDEERETNKDLLEKCLENLKMATRRYARKQNKWINNRFLNKNSTRQVPSMYGLNTSDISKWTDNVTNPAIEIVQSFIDKTECKYTSLEKLENTKSKPNAKDETFFCETCQRIFIGDFQWDIHLKSHRHKRVLYKKSRNASNTNNISSNEN